MPDREKFVLSRWILLLFRGSSAFPAGAKKCKNRGILLKMMGPLKVRMPADGFGSFFNSEMKIKNNGKGASMLLIPF